jgi:hypothetical protein
MNPISACIALLCMAFSSWIAPDILAHTCAHSLRTLSPHSPAHDGQVVDVDGIAAEEVGDCTCKASYIPPLPGQPNALSETYLSSVSGSLDLKSGGEDGDDGDAVLPACNNLKDTDVRFPYTPYNPDNNTERYIWIQDCTTKGACGLGGLCIQNDAGAGQNHPCTCS